MVLSNANLLRRPTTRLVYWPDVLAPFKYIMSNFIPDIKAKSNKNESFFSQYVRRIPQYTF